MSETQRIHKIVKQWLEHAEEDLRLAKHAFKLSSSRPYKLIAFHAQQCAEKYLKAFLALKKVDFPLMKNSKGRAKPIGGSLEKSLFLKA